MKKLVIAGACSVYNLSRLKEAFTAMGFDTSFVDAPFMAGIKIHDYNESEEILYTADLSFYDAVIPLSEYWISWCKNHHCPNIASRALEASRSKRFLYDFMKSKGFDYPVIYGDENEARLAMNEGRRIIIKPEGLHSGYGIEILDKSKEQLLEKYFDQAKNIKNRTLRIMEIENKGAMITEAVEGVEYSADCFWNKGCFSVVRLCRKKISVINDKPCVTVYSLLEPENQDYEKYRAYLKNWTCALFDEGDMSFAQFDFIDDGHRVVPIDFACRVGGGVSDLLMETGECAYARAVEGKDGVLNKGRNLKQFSYLPVVTGYVTDDDYDLIPGKTRVFKKKGDYVISNPSSVGSRIALTVTDFAGEIPEEYFSCQLIGAKNIDLS